MKKSVFNLGKGKEPLKVIRGGVFAMMLGALVCAAGSCKGGLGDSVDTEAPSGKIVYPDPRHLHTLRRLRRRQADYGGKGHTRNHRHRRDCPQGRACDRRQLVKALAHRPQ